MSADSSLLRVVSAIYFSGGTDEFDHGSAEPPDREARSFSQTPIRGTPRDERLAFEDLRFKTRDDVTLRGLASPRNPSIGLLLSVTATQGIFPIVGQHTEASRDRSERFHIRIIGDTA